jgi:CheY-like chemotaxis protein
VGRTTSVRLATMDDLPKSTRAVPARARKRAADRQASKGKSRVCNATEELRTSLQAFLGRVIATASGEAGCLQLTDPVSGEISFSLRAGSSALGGEIASAAVGIRSRLRWESLNTRSNERAYLLRLPLTRSTSDAVGVVYIVSACPRKLTRDERHTLTVLARYAAEHVLSVRASERRQLRRDRFAYAQKASGVSTFEWDVVSDTIKGDATFSNLCGIPERAEISFQRFLSTVQWTYRLALSDALAQTIPEDSGRCRRVPLVFQPSGAEPSSSWVLGGCTSFVDGRAIAFTGVLVETRCDVPTTKQAAAASAAANAMESVKSLDSADPHLLSGLTSLHPGNRLVTPTALSLRHQAAVMEGLLASGRVSPRSHSSLRKRISLQSLLQDAVDTACPWIESGLHDLVIDCPCPATVIEVEPVRMGNALAELLINAAIYTPTGGHIVLRVRESDCQVDISVQDDGQGMTPHSLPHLFDAYCEVGRSLQRAAGRLGIGLGVVRATVALHGGAVVALSPGIGRGTTFKVTLPLSRHVSKAAMAAPSADVPPVATDFRRRFLIACDDTDAAQSAVDLLREQGHEVLFSDDSVEAVTVAHRRRPHLVLVNVSLPDSVGYHLARRMRSLPLTPLPVVVPIGDVVPILRDGVDHGRDCVVALSRFHLRTLQRECVCYFHAELEQAAEQLRRSIDFPRAGAHQSAVAGATRLLQTLLVLLPVLTFSVQQCVELSARMSTLRQRLGAASRATAPFA